ncbi:LPXTG cell wall anchor domain-containing protein [Aeromicrobium sp. Leaf350]|uniref:LPXTG cell wall anchor domain-containing protein n=1 Tax=Aeromicrobium sp. Leaf350 TaxID=2876565 RepID=UPI001E5A08CD|nr:LPXTG cell wall anchor domain-containing protein [Aeromicrobium sp. Leaf350]
MTVRRSLLPLLGAVLGGLLALLWVTPAHAADEIGVSVDGSTWMPAITAPLFDPAMRWIPGDDETRTFYVRAQGPSAATMSIEALTPAGDPFLESDIDLSVRVDGGAWVALDPAQVAQDLTVRPVPVGDVVTVDVRAFFDPASTNVTQARQLPLQFRITLAEAFPSDANPAGNAGSGSLPTTGAQVGLDLFLLGLLTCAAGGAVLAARRKGEEQHG